MRQEWLTSGQVAERLGVHVTTINRWADRGELKCWKTPGGRRRFTLDDVEQFMADGRPAA